MDDKTQQELDVIKVQLLESLRSSDWLSRLDERQRRLIANARLYAENDPAGLPGHQLLLIISKLAGLLDEYEPVNALDKQ